MNQFKTTLAVGFLVLASASNACGQRFNSIPAAQLPPAARVSPKQNQAGQQSNISYLQQAPQANYYLDDGDVLAVFVEGVLGEINANPPVQNPPAGSDLPPSLGFPVLVMEDGSISLPLVKRLPVRGLTIRQAEELIQRTFKGGNNPILSEQNRILVTLMRKRTANVIVVRQDLPARTQGRTRNQPVTFRSDQSSRVESLQLPVGENDVFNALLETGGLPGLNAKPNVRVRRSASYRPSYSTEAFPRSGRSAAGRSDNRFSNIPLRVPAGGAGRYQRPNQQTGTLRSGDIVHVDARPTEVYYTGGLLGGGEFPLPRDTDLDVTQAVALAGGAPVGNGNRRFGPTELTVIRKLPDGRQVAIRVNLNRALVNPAERLLVAPGDVLILRNSPAENIGNVGVGVFNTFGVRQLFQ